MTQLQSVHIEPSKHSTEEVDEFLRHIEGNVDTADGARPPVVKPNKDLGEDGKPNTENQGNERI